MPNMDGEETLRELRRIQDDVKVVFSSGYHEQDMTERLAGVSFAGFLNKPYTEDALVGSCARRSRGAVERVTVSRRYSSADDAMTLPTMP